MEVVQRLTCLYVVCSNPCELFIRVLVAHPFDQVPEFNPVPPVELGVNDLFDLEMLFAVDLYRRWWRDFSTGEGIPEVGFELRNMENWVNLGQIFWKSHLERGSARFSNNLVRTDVRLRELRSWTLGLDVLGGNEHLIADFDVRMLNAFPVRRFLVSTLCRPDLVPEELVEFVEIDHEVASVCVGDVEFRMDGQEGIVAFIREERSNACGGVRSVVQREFGKRKECIPIILLVRAVNADVLLDRLVHPFRLTIGFRMVTRSIMDLHVEEFAQRTKEG